MNERFADAGIPVLTEIIAAPPGRAIIEPAPGLHHAERPSEELEQRITRQVLERVLTQVDRVLEQRMRNALTDVLQIAVEGLAHEVRSGLAADLEHLIARTVEAELRQRGNPVD